MRRWHIPPDWSYLPTPGRQARQTLAGGTRIDRQTATANTEEKGSKHSERDKQPSYCQITKLAVYRTEPPACLGGAGSSPPFGCSSWSQPGDGVRCLSTTKVRLSSQPHAGNLCPPSNRTPSCTHSTCHATHQCHGCIVCRLPTTIPHSPPRYLAGKETGSAPHGSGRIGGLGLPGRASLAPGATCPRIQLPCLVTGSGRASPGLSLVTQNKQSLLTGREVRDAQRRRPLCLEGSSSCVARYPPKAGTRI